MSDSFHTISSQESEEHWISISDLMTGLMVIFLFIAISYMMNVVKQNRAYEEIAETYKKVQIELYNDLNDKFQDNLKEWNAEIDSSTLTIHLQGPKILFKQGKAELSPRFKNILNQFFPKYIDVLTKEEYFDNITEIRIEGHTSSEWSHCTSSEHFGHVGR